MCVARGPSGRPVDYTRHTINSHMQSISQPRRALCQRPLPPPHLPSRHRSYLSPYRTDPGIPPAEPSPHTSTGDTPRAGRRARQRARRAAEPPADCTPRAPRHHPPLLRCRQRRRMRPTGRSLRHREACVPPRPPPACVCPRPPTPTLRRHACASRVQQLLLSLLALTPIISGSPLAGSLRIRPSRLVCVSLFLLW